MKVGEEKSFNKDKVTSDGFRLNEGSGVYLDKPPFSIKWQEVLSCPENIYVEDEKTPGNYILKEAYIKTFLLSNF